MDHFKGLRPLFQNGRQSRELDVAVRQRAVLLGDRGGETADQRMRFGEIIRQGDIRQRGGATNHAGSESHFAALEAPPQRKNLRS